MKTLFLFLLLASAAYSALVTEQVGGPHAVIAQCDGAKLTDCAALYPADVGLNNKGVTPGYSKFSCVSDDGRWFIAFHHISTESGLFHDGVFVRKLRHPFSTSSANGIGEAYDPRWHDNSIYYHWNIGSQADYSIWKQDAATGATVRVAKFPAAILADGHCGQSDRYRAVKVGAYGTGRLWLIDLDTNQATDTGLPVQYMADVSPSGKWLFSDANGDTAPARFYFIPALLVGNKGQYVELPTLKNGHDGWGTDAEGREYFVWQDAGDDWFAAFCPDTEKRINLINYAELGYGANLGVHFARMTTPRGWALMATYANDSLTWPRNQLMMVEVKEGARRLVRLGSSGNLHIPSAYYTEGWANEGAGAAWWGANNNGASNLELYRLPLPDLEEETPWTQLIVVTARATTGTLIIKIEPIGK